MCTPEIFIILPPKVACKFNFIKYFLNKVSKAIFPFQTIDIEKFLLLNSTNSLIFNFVILACLSNDKSLIKVILLKKLKGNIFSLLKISLDLIAFLFITFLKVKSL